MTQVSKGRSKPVASFAVAAIVMAGAATTTLQAKDGTQWRARRAPTGKPGSGLLAERTLGARGRQHSLDLSDA
jgi:hypothetical protein